MNIYTAERIALEITESGKVLPPLPAVSQQILGIARQPFDQVDVDDFCKLIESDPALTALLLQLANSSYFGTIKQIVGVRQAIMHMGMAETINSVIDFLFSKYMAKAPVFEDFSATAYWDYSKACATANQMLAHPIYSKMVQGLPGELYIAGLLHGIGKIFLSINRPEQFERCLNQSKTRQLPFEQAEVEIIGTTNTEVAYHVLKQWNLPEQICLTIRHFKSPYSADKQYRGGAALTQLAYSIAATSGIGSNGEGFEYKVENSYVVENWMLDKEARNHQDQLIANIYATLQKKAQQTKDDEQKTNLDGPPTEPKDNPASTVPQKKKGLMGKLLSFVK